MNESFQPVFAHLQKEIARGTFPSAQFVIGERGHIMAEGALGYPVLEPKKIPATNNTLYDLASLTKPLVTALLTISFRERGLLDVAAPASLYLEELCNTDKSAITLLQLLTHTSGLPPWRPLYLESPDRKGVVQAIAETALAHPFDPKSPPPVLYSDLNFILLGFILERLSAARLDRLAQAEIFAPLGLQHTCFNPPTALRRQVAATERGQGHERRTVAAMKFACPLDAPGLPQDESSNPATGASGGKARKSAQTGRPDRRPLRRKQVLWGEVHDGNAYFMEGVSGHAGLFSTAREVFAIARQFLPGSRLLAQPSLAWFTRNLTPGIGDQRSAGWLLAATQDCSAGPGLPPAAFGHNGFTGTSVWIDGASERVYVLLTNRVHPQVRDLGMKAARQRFHELAAAALEALSASK